MKKLSFVYMQLATISGLVLMMIINAAAVVHDKDVIIPLNSNSAKIPGNTSPCNSSTAGFIRWTGLVFEGCDGTAWTLLSPVPTVYSSGHKWMDRNLGASQVAVNPTDSAAYGDLYQWGRFSDGHEKRDSGITAVNATSNNDDPGHPNFILVSVLPYDWRNPQNHTLWQADPGINNPCPTGFRLPTATEWEAERLSWGSENNSAGAYNSPLKLVRAGGRNGDNGALLDAGSGGYYWSATVGGGGSFGLYFDHGYAEMLGGSHRAHGFSVRCLED